MSHFEKLSCVQVSVVILTNIRTFVAFLFFLTKIQNPPKNTYSADYLSNTLKQLSRELNIYIYPYPLPQILNLK